MLRGRWILIVAALATVAAVISTSPQGRGPKRDEATILVKFVKPSSDDADQIADEGD